MWLILFFISYLCPGKERSFILFFIFKFFCQSNSSFLLVRWKYKMLETNWRWICNLCFISSFRYFQSNLLFTYSRKVRKMFVLKFSSFFSVHSVWFSVSYLFRLHVCFRSLSLSIHSLMYEYDTDCMQWIFFSNFKWCH